MSCESVLLEYNEKENLFTSSAILINNRWILFPAASLIIFLNTNNIKTIPNELIDLETSKLIYQNYLDLSPDNLKIIMQSTKDFKYFLAKFVAFFSCKNIKTTTNFPLGCGENFSSKFDYNNFLSLFIILDIEMHKDFNEIDLFTSFNKLIKNSSEVFINRGSLICIENTPFGCREFLCSYSEGIICNCVGNENCFILTDASTAPGSEGGPIFAFRNNNKKSPKIPIGIVISSLNWWRGENTGLTLGIMLIPLLTQLLPKKWNITQYLFSNKNSVMYKIDKSIVQVFCGNGWGTGILIDKNLGIFITGSHVVQNGLKGPITLKWGNTSFSCSLVYRTENIPPIYDIAILRCSPKNISKMSAIKFGIKPAVQGEKVLAAGYPIFNSNDPIFPLVTKGNVSLVNNCIMHTTCVVLAGSSGGAIIRPNGELIGLIVCHTTISQKNDFIVYPKINMGIPINAIAGPLLQFIKNKDVNVLKKLESNDIHVKTKWNYFHSKM